MTWEYVTIRISSGDSRSVDEELTRWGQDHWELVAVVPYGSETHVAYFKRQTDFLRSKSE